MNDEFKLNLTIQKDFDKFQSLQKQSGIYSAIFSELLCVISKYPKKIHRNSNNNLHNSNESAIEWGNLTESTKWNCYYLNGRNMPSWIYEEEVTKDKFLKEENEDIKAGIITMVKENKGNDGLLEFLNAECMDEQTLVHENGRLEVIKLYKTKEKYSFLCDANENFNQPYAWTSFSCPSTGQQYLIDTSAHFTNALDSIKFHRPNGVPNELEYNWAQFAN